MKKSLVFAMALLYVSLASAQINTVVVNTSGDVTLRQGKEFNINYEKSGTYEKVDTVLYLGGSGDFTVTVEGLYFLEINSSGDVITDGTFNGNALYVDFNSSGDSKLDLDYNLVDVVMNGSGDLVLRGRCDRLNVQNNGSGDLHTKRLDASTQSITLGGVRMFPNMKGLKELLYELGVNLEHLSDSVDWESFERDMQRWGDSMEEWGRHVEEWGEQVERSQGSRHRGQGWDKPHNGPKPEKANSDSVQEQKSKEQPKQEQTEKKSLLFNPHWNGVEAGLNMLLYPGASSNGNGQHAFLELRPMMSWNFNFNLADVGIAFNRNHVAGLYTGLGLGWNNYSFSNPVRLVKVDDQIVGQWLNENTDKGKVRRSKLGVLYVQMPLMIEVRPTRKFFIAAGVTGGLRVDTWTKIKYENKSKEKSHCSSFVNPFKLDATLRAGGNDVGFYATYNLLTLFDNPKSHTFCFGVSMLF